MSRLRVTLAGFAVILSCSLLACEANESASVLGGGATGAAEVGQKTAKTVGAAGGQVSTPGNTASINLPAGSLSGTTPVTLVVKDANSVPNTLPVLSNVYDFGPSGTTFNQSATLAIKMSSAPPAGQNPVLAYLDANNTWQVLLGSTYDAQSGTVTAATTHFTLFSVITMAADGTGCATQNDPQAYCAEQNLICDTTLNRCATPAFTVGGTVGGLAGSLTLSNNGNDSVTISTGASFQFSGTYNDHADYNVTITAQPDGQTCAFSTVAAGTIQTASVLLNINCLSNFSVGGNLSGLEDGGTVVLANGNDTLTLTANADFTFAAPVPNSQPFAVQLVSQPNEQTCVVSNATGLPQAANVTNVTVVCTYNPVPLAGDVSGLVDGTFLTLGNGNDVVNVGGAAVVGGNFTVAQGTVGAYYDYSVLTQPDGQTCTISGSGSGVVAPNDPNVLTIACVPNTYTVGGTISGLLASNTVALSLGSETITLGASDNGFNFTTPVTYATPYAVAIATQPVGQQCVFTGGVANGNMVGENITNLQVTCKVASYVLSGTVNGLPAGSAVALTLNGVTAIPAASATTVSANITGSGGGAAGLAGTAGAAAGIGAAGTVAAGTVGLNIPGFSSTGGELLKAGSGQFSFRTPVQYNQAFSVSISSPPGMQCAIWGSPNDFSQVMPAGNFNAISVSCQPQSFSLGGRVTGLLDNAFVTLQNGSDALTVTNGSFLFPTSVVSGGNYAISITSPSGQRCDFGAGSRGSGVMGGGAIGNIAVNCAAAPFYIGGTVTGLAQGANLVIQSDQDIISASNGVYELPTPYLYESPYDVIVIAPTHQACGFVNSPDRGLAQGTMPAGDLTTLDIYCAPPTYRLGGTVNGLVANTNVMLQNGADSLSVGNGTFAFATTLAVSASYNVQITSPAAQTCAFGPGIAGSGTIGTDDVTNLAVGCAPQRYQLGGQVSGLQANTRVTLRNGADSITATNGNYAFTTPVAFGASYAATVTAPTGQTCQFISAGAPPAGAMPQQNVTTLGVACGSIFYNLGGQVSGLAANTRVSVSDGVDTISLANGTYTFPTRLVAGVGFNVTLAPPAGQACAFTGAGSGTIASDVTNINIACAPIPYALGGNVVGLLPNTTVTINNGSDSIQVGSGPYTLPTALNANAAYNVGIVNPAGQTCTWAGATAATANSGATGRVQNANVVVPDIVCMVNQYFISGTITGLKTPNSVRIRNGLDAIIGTNGNFTLPTPLFLGGSYAVTLYPYGNQACSFTGAFGGASAQGSITAAGLSNLQISCVAPAFSLGGYVSGLVPGATVTLTNGNDTISVGNGAYSFPTAVASGASYQIGVSPSSAQTCTVSGGAAAAGTVGASGIVTANVVCASRTFPLGGTVAGLIGNGNLVVSNGNDTLAVQNGNFTFPTQVAYGAPYAVAIKAPAGQLCQVVATGAAPAGAMPGNAVSNLTIKCSASSFTLGGNISGLTTTGVVKLQNGNDTVAAGNGPYTFATTLITGVDYNVALISPAGQTCKFTADATPAGTIVASSINNINVSCAANAYSIGWKVGGLLAGSTVQLSNGTDQLVAGNGAFAFPTLLNLGASFNVTVSSPQGQTCGFPGAGSSIAGVMGNNNVALLVGCTPLTYPVSVTVAGLSGGNIIVKSGADAVTMQNGNTTLPTQVAYAATYGVAFAQPANQTCSFDRNGAPSQGVVTGPVALRINCTTPTFPIGGYVTGLPPNTTVGVRNGNDSLQVPTGPYALPTQVAWGATYNVTLSAPGGYTCGFAASTAASGGGQGVVDGAPVTNINIGCQLQLITLAGRVTGLSGAGNVTITNQADFVSAGNGTYALPTPIGFGTTYRLAAIGPAYQTCAFNPNLPGANANTLIGTAGNANVTNLDVACVDNLYPLTALVSGLPTNANGQITLRNGNDVIQAGSGRTSLPTGLAHNASYAVGLTSPAGWQCQFTGNANGTLARGTTSPYGQETLLAVTCSAVTYTLGGTVSGAVAGSQVFITNGQDIATVIGNGSAGQAYVMPIAVAPGTAYSLAVTPSSAQTCAFVSGTATQGTANANVTALNVRCTPNPFRIGGSVSGLVGNLNVGLRNGNDNITVGNGNYSFPTTVAYGAPFNPAIASPQFETCQFVNHGLPVNGNMPGQDYLNLDVVCGGNTISIGGTVAGLLASGRVTIYNGNDRVVSGNGNFTLPTPVVSGSGYALTAVGSAGQSCAVANPNLAQGIAGNGPVAVSVVCTAQTYTLGGTLTRSLSDSNITLSNANETLTLRAAGPFTFATQVAFNTSYSVTRSVPTGEVCRFSQSSAGDANTVFAGFMGAGNVNNVNLTCVPVSNPVVVSVTGLAATTSLSLRNGNDTLNARNGQNSLPTAVAYESGYAVTLATTGAQTCAFTSGGTVAQGSMPATGLNLSVVCTTPMYTLSGSVSGLAPNTSVTLKNGNDVVQASGNFAFPTPVAAGSTYAVALGQTTGQSCSFAATSAAASGTITANIATLNVVCYPQVYPVSVVISGLTGNNNAVVRNGSDSASVGNGNYIFATPVAYGAQVLTSVASPDTQTCQFGAGGQQVSATMSTSFAPLQIVCRSNPYTIGGSVSGLLTNASVQLQNGNQTIAVSNGNYTFPGTVLAGTAYKVSVSPVAGQICSFNDPNSYRGVVAGPVNNVSLTCSIANFALMGNVYNLLPNSQLTLSDNIDQVTVGNGAFSFPTPIGINLPYTVNAYPPAGQICNFAPGNGNATAGVMTNANGPGLTVKCNPAAYPISGTVSGLTGNANLFAKNGNDLVRLSNGTFNLPTAVAYNSQFSVTLVNGGPQVCNFTGSYSGTVAGGLMGANGLAPLNVYCTTPSFSVGGTVTGLVGTEPLRLQNNGDATASAGGNFVFPVSIPAGSNYNVTFTQPTGQSCSFVNAASAQGSIVANVTNIAIACTPQQFLLGGVVSGLTANAVVGLQNGNDTLRIGNGNYTFPTPVAYNAAYSALVTSPNLQTCQFSANGTPPQSRMPGAAVNTLNVVCGTNAYPVGGTVSGLPNNTNVTLSNGGDVIAAGNGAFTFPTQVIAGSSYNVSVASPPGWQCGFANAASGQGSVQGAVSNIGVVCTAGRYTLGGTVTNLAANTNVVIANGNDTVSVGNGAFTLPTSLSGNANFQVQLQSPVGQTCVIGVAATAGANTSGSANAQGPIAIGTVANANVNFNVQCSLNYYSLGGFVQGLQTSNTIVLKTATDTLTQAGPGQFTFPTVLPYNAPYTVSVRSASNQVCNFTANGGNVIQGVMPATPVQSLGIFCYTPNYSIGGTVSGLLPNAQVTLINNGFDSYVSSGGNYTFMSPVSAGGAYNVTLANQPAGEVCTLPATSAQGGPVNANVTNVNVACVPQYYPLGGQVAGLMPNVAAVVRNGNDRLVVGNGNFSFPTLLGYAANYNVTVDSPATQTCQIGGQARGHMPAGAVNGINVLCGPLQGNFTISGYVSNLMADTNVTLSDGLDTIVAANGSFTFPSYVPGSSTYQISLVSPPGQTCTFGGNANGVSGVVNGNVTGIGVQCTPNYYSLGGYVSLPPNGGNITIRNGSDSITVGRGVFTLPTLLAFNAPYSAQVSTTTPYLNCVFQNGSTGNTANGNIAQGVMPAYPLQTLNVLCSYPFYPVNGAVTGLVPNTGVSLTNNGTDVITAFGGNYVFPNMVQAGGNYNVTVASPPGETCATTGAAAGIVTTSAATVNVGCVPQRFVLGGQINGLNANNLVTLTNGNDRLVIGNGNYTFATPVAYGAVYNANVISPNYQTCQFSALPGTGQMPPSDVASLNVQCGSQQGNFTVAGSVTGLGANATVTITRGNDNVIVGNGAYQLPTQLHGGDAYSITVSSPAGMTCAFAGGGSAINGIASSIVNNLPIQCVTAAYTLGGMVSPGNFPQGANVILRSGNDTITAGAGQFAFPTPVAFNANYMVSVSSTMPYLSCGFAGTAGSTGVNSNVISGVMPAGGTQALYVMCSMATYPVGGNVVGLLPNTSISIYNNGTDGVTSYGGTFVFPTWVTGGQNYNVTVAQPQGQSCGVAAGAPSAGVVTGPIGAVAIFCVPQRFTLGGAVSGLNPNTSLTLQNGSDRIVVSNGNYTFPTPVAYSAGYSATFSVPGNQTCQFSGLPGSGIMPSNAVNQLNVSCAALQGNFQISGNVNNLVPGTAVVLSDGVDNIQVSNGAFSFPTALHTGTNYAINVQSPQGQTCSVAGNANGALQGTIQGPVTGIQVNCVTGTYSLGGVVYATNSVSGQSPNVIIRNGNDVLSVAAGGAFTLPTPVAFNAPVYLTAISANPYGACYINVNGAQNSNLVSNGNVLQGPMPAQSVQSISINCYVPMYQVGGTVTGLNANTPLQLTNNGNDATTVTTGTFSFPNLVSAGGNFAVGITQPVGQTCSIAAGSGQGTVTTSNISSIAISCVPNTYALGGRISGLAANSNVVVRNGNDAVSTGNGNYTFATRVTWGTPYSATLSAPSGQICQFSPLAPSGVMPAAAVTNLSVVCGTSTYTVGGQVSGLSANTNVTLFNGNDLISVANGNFTFPTGVVPGGTYNVRVQSPQNQGCAFVNPGLSAGSPTANVTNLAILCVQGNYIVRGTVAGLVANTNIYLTDNLETAQVGNGNYMLPTPLGAGTNYTVSLASAIGHTCTFGANGNSISGVVTGNVTLPAMGCVPNTYSVAGVVSPGNFPAGATVTLKNGNDTLTTGSGSFSLPTPVVFNGNYAFSVSTSYPYLNCTVGNSNVQAGTMPPNNLFLYVQCSIPSYQVSGTVAGLPAGNGVNLYNNQDGIYAGNGNFIFPTWVSAGGNYSVSIGQMPGAVCSFGQGSAPQGIATAPVSNINVVCVPQPLGIGGFISGLNGNNRVVLYNGNDVVSLSNGNYTLPTPVAAGGNYSVTLTSPNGQSCQFNGYSPAGVMPQQAITNLNVACAQSGGNFQISGNVNNLAANSNVTLYDGFDTISIGNGPFAFPTPLSSGTGYFIQVQSPAGQSCTIGGAATMQGQINGPVNVSITCGPSAYSLGGYVTISDNSNVILTNGNDRIVVGNGQFMMPSLVGYNTQFSLLATSTSQNNFCAISGFTGPGYNANMGINGSILTMPAYAVTNLQVSCYTPSFLVGGAVNGLNANTSVTLSLNGSAAINVGNGNYTFPNGVQNGNSYQVSLNAPAGQSCNFVPAAAAAGTIATANVSNVNINCTTNLYSLGGSITGLNANTQVTLHNGNDTVTSGNGNYTFATRLPFGASYSATVSAPSGQFCQFSPLAAAGTVQAANITNLSVVCAATTYTLSGTVTGLANNANVVLYNGNDVVSAGNGNFRFPTGIVPGGNYNVSLAAPSAQGCYFSSQSTGSPTGNVNNLAVRCLQGNFTIAGMVSGLLSNTNVVVTDGVDTLQLGNGNFAFPSTQVAGTAYTVSVLSSPGQTCTFSSGGNTTRGTLLGNVNNVGIYCTPATYLVGGIVSPGGFPANATVTIRNGNDTITTGSGSFTLPTPVAYNAPYAVSISSSYPYLQCSVAGNTNSTIYGNMPPNNLSLYIQCFIPSYPVGGTVSGLPAGTSVSIYDNGVDGITVSNGNFQFPTAVTAGANFNVTIASAQGQSCALAQGSPQSGVVTGPIGNISIVCSGSGSNGATAQLGGTITGLAQGDVVTVTDGFDTVQVGNGAYGFPTPVSTSGGTWTALLSSPTGKTCVFVSSQGASASGAFNSAATQINISCSVNLITLSGFAAAGGPNANVVIRSGNDTISVRSGAFTLPTPIPFGAAFTVSASSTNAYATCNISEQSGQSSGSTSTNGNVLTGTMASALYPITDLYINCYAPFYQVGGTVSGLNANATLSLTNNGTDTVATGNGNFTFPTPLASGSAYAVGIAQIPGQFCGVAQGTAGGTVGGSNVGIGITCANQNYSLGGNVTGLLANTNITLKNGNDTIKVVNGNYNFTTALAFGGNYNATLTSPAGQTCQYSQVPGLPGVRSGLGTMPAGNVNNLNVFCATTTYGLAGTVSGLNSNTTVTLKNGTDSIAASNGNFTLPTRVVSGAGYSIAVVSPTGQGCAFTNPNQSNGIAGGNVANLAVACVQGNFTISATVGQYTGNGNFLLTNGQQSIGVSNGTFTFPAQAAGTAYTVAVAGGLSGQSCTVNGNANGFSGTLAGNVNVTVQCAANAYPLGGTVSPGGLPPGATVTLSDGVDTVTAAGGAFTFPTPVVYNTNYAVSVIGTSVPGMVCNFAGGNNSNVIQGVMPGNPMNGLYLMCSVPMYAISGNVTGLQANQQVYVTDYVDNASLYNGPYSFTPLRAGSAYRVSLALGQPGCAFVGNGNALTVSGTLSAPVTLNIDCSGSYKQLGGTVSGLLANSNVLVYDGVEKISVSNGTYAFTKLAPATWAGWNAALQSPPGQTCAFVATNGTTASGPLSAAGQININCSVNTYTLSGWASAGGGNNTITIRNGNDVLHQGSGGFSLPTPVPYGGTYSIVVSNSNPYASCNLSDASGQSMSNGNVLTGTQTGQYPDSAIYINCYTPTYQVMGTVSGLNDGVVLQLVDNGTDTTTVGNGQFYFPTLVATGGNYAVTFAQPTGQTCSVTSGPAAGIMGTAGVNIGISCVNGAYTLGGRVAGLAANTNVTLRNGNDTLSVTNGNYTFPTAVAFGGNYNATLTAPGSQLCQYSAAPSVPGTPASQGTMPGGNVNNLNVYCGTGNFTLAGTVSGLNANTKVTLKNGSDTITVANGNFVLPTGVVAGASYNIQVIAPANQACALSNPNLSIGVPTANVTNLAVACLQGNFTISGTLNGWTGNQNATLWDGFETISIANGAFSFPSTLPAGYPYNLSVQGGAGQSCTFNNNPNLISGTVAGNLGVTIRCTPNAFPLGGMISQGGIPPGATVTLTDGIDTITVGSGSFTFPTPLVYNTNYLITLLSSSVPGMTCNFQGQYGGSNYPVTMPGYPISSLYVSCSVSNATIGGTVTGLGQYQTVSLTDNVDTLTVANNGTWSFPTPLRAGTNYMVSLLIGQPGCVFTSNPGVNLVTGIAGSPNSIGIDCSGMAADPNFNVATFTLGGSVSGLLDNTGLGLGNGNDFISVMNGAYQFPTLLPGSGPYAQYSVYASPPQGQRCSNYGSPQNGVMGNANLQSVNFACGLALNFQNNQAAIAVVGQPNFTSATAQATSARSVAGPVGRAFNTYQGTGTTYFPDPASARALVFQGTPQGNGAAAQDVLGQATLNSNVAVTHATASPNTFAPSDIAGDRNTLVLSDPSNNRVLLWEGGFPGFGSHLAASVVVGQTALSNANNTGACTATGLNAPKAAATGNGILAIADANNNRVMVYRHLPTANGAAADLVLGQTSFTTCTGNTGGAVSGTTLSYPSGVWTDGNSLLVVDTNNNRVLAWRNIPTASGQLPDIVFGQGSFTTNTPGTTYGTLSAPASVTSDGVSVFVADTGNSRVMIFPIPSGGSTVSAATSVLGQYVFNQGNCNVSGVSSSGLCRPTGVSISGTSLIVTDTGNSRFMIFGSN